MSAIYVSEYIYEDNQLNEFTNDDNIFYPVKNINENDKKSLETDKEINDDYVSNGKNQFQEFFCASDNKKLYELDDVDTNNGAVSTSNTENKNDKTTKSELETSLPSFFGELSQKYASNHSLIDIEKSLKYSSNHSLFKIEKKEVEVKVIVPRTKKIKKSKQEKKPKAPKVKKLPKAKQSSTKQPQVKNLPLQTKENNQKSVSQVPKEETKNLLRNFGAAQTNFIRHNKYAFNIIHSQFKNIKKEERKDKINEFYDWVPRKPETFIQFQKLWSSEGEFEQLYKQLCIEFYTKFAVQYIYMNSKISHEHRIYHLKYMHRFIEGISDPISFYYFRKTGQ